MQKNYKKIWFMSPKDHNTHNNLYNDLKKLHYQDEYIKCVKEDILINNCNALIKTPNAIHINHFGDGEINCSINDGLNKRINFNEYPDIIFLSYNISYPINDSVMGLIFLLDSLKRRYPVTKIHLFIPYMPYCRHDRACGNMHHISTNIFANLIEQSGNVEQIICMDSHIKQIEGCFKKSVINIDPTEYFINNVIYKEEHFNINTIIVAPDIGASERARKFIEHSNKIDTDHNIQKKNPIIGYAVIEKKRYAEKTEIHGISLMDKEGNYLENFSIKGMRCIIVDDMVDGGSTLINASKFLKQKGSSQIDACITHGVLIGNKKAEDGQILALSKLSNNFKYCNGSIYISDSINIQNKYLEKYDNVSIIEISKKILSKYCTNNNCINNKIYN